jgi:hypothetical protein
MAAILVALVLKLHQNGLLDTRVIPGDGTTTAKKGGDNIGFSGHKKLKGDKVVAFCDRRCNVIAPFVSAPGNRNESPLLREVLPHDHCHSASFSVLLLASATIRQWLAADRLSAERRPSRKYRMTREFPLCCPPSARFCRCLSRSTQS